MKRSIIASLALISALVANTTYGAELPLAKKRLTIQMGDGTVLAGFGDGGGCAFSHDGQLIVAGSLAGIQLWDTTTGKASAVQIGDEQEIGLGVSLDGSAALMPDKKSFVTGSEQGILRQYDVGSGKLIRKLGSPLADDKDAARVLAGLPRNLEARDRELREDTAKGSGMLQAMVISADGKYLAASTMVGVGVMDLTTGKGRTLDIYGQKQIHSGGAGAQYGSTQGISQHLAFTADGKSLVCGRGDGSFRVYDPQTGKVLRTLARRGKPGFAPQAIAGDGSRVAWFDYATATVRIADVATGKDVRTLKLPQGSTIMADGPNGMDLSHDGQAIACSIMTKEGPGQILVADVKTGKFVATLTEKTDKRAEKPTRKPKKGVVQNGGAAGTPAGNSPATGPSTSGNTGPAAPVPSGFGGGLSGGGGFGGGGFGGGFIAGGAGKFGGGRSGGGVAVGGGRGGGGFGRGVQAGAVNEGPAEFPTGMETVVFSPDGKSIATSGFGGQIILWENPLNPAAAVSPGESAK